MTFRALLLRLVLTIALVLNGVPLLHAGMHAATDDGSAEVAAQATAAGGGHATPSCHDQDDATADTPQAPDPARDCCDGGDCRCACLHHVNAVAAQALRLKALCPPSDLALRIEDPHPSLHASPPLRPPIA